MYHCKVLLYKVLTFLITIPINPLQFFSDINECSTLNGGCNQVCTNQVGSFQCECLRGYRLSPDQRTCADINECAEQKPCDAQHGVCTNVRGSYKCSCVTGFYLLIDKRTCQGKNAIILLTLSILWPLSTIQSSQRALEYK